MKSASIFLFVLSLLAASPARAEDPVQMSSGNFVVPPPPVDPLPPLLKTYKARSTVLKVMDPGVRTINLVEDIDARYVSTLISGALLPEGQQKVIRSTVTFNVLAFDRVTRSYKPTRVASDFIAVWDTTHALYPLLVARNAKAGPFTIEAEITPINSARNGVTLRGQCIQDDCDLGREMSLFVYSPKTNTFEKAITVPLTQRIISDGPYVSLNVKNTATVSWGAPDSDGSRNMIVTTRREDFGSSKKQPREAVETFRWRNGKLVLAERRVDGEVQDAALAGRAW